MELSESQIRDLTNHFVKTGMEVGLQSACGGGRQICLFRHHDGWSIELVEHTEKRLSKAVTHFDYPGALPDGEIDAAIELAGLISMRLHEWAMRSNIGKSAGRRSAAILTPEQRSERAKKAVAARIAKYGQKRKG